MPYASGGKNVMLNGLAAVATHASLHSGLPNDTGSNELTGGSPAYARKSLGAWVAASGGSMDKNAADPVFDVPAGDVVAVGFWSALTVGTFYGWAPVNGGSTSGVGTMANTGDVITSYAHGLSNGHRVYLVAVVGSSLPTGVDGVTLYYVVGASADTFQVSLTLGGTAVTVSADGELFFQRIIVETFGVQGTLTLDTLTLNLNA